MKIIENGEVGHQSVIPFILSDTEQVFTNREQALFELKKKAGALLHTATQTTIDHFTYSNVFNLWKVVGKDEIAQIAASGDAGFAITAGQFSGSLENLNGNGIFNSNRFTNLKKSNEPTFLLYVNKDNADLGATLHINQHQHGILFEANLSNRHRAYFLFTQTGILFFHDVVGYAAPFGFLNENSTLFNPISHIEPFRIYALQAIIMQAKGNVQDAAKKPAAHCHVRAYNRETGQLIGQGISNTDGTYQFPIAATKGDEIYMVCLDNEQAPDFEARIIDRITV